MRKLLFLFIVFVSIPFTNIFSQAPNWGLADTLEHHKIGPGIQYSKIYFTGKKMLIWVTTIDLTNPYNKVEQAQSRSQVPDVLRWLPQTFFSQNSRPGHKVCAAFNHDFFSYEHGIAIGFNISEGEVTYGGGWGRSLLTISDDKQAGVINPVLDANVILPDASKVKIDFFNANALGLNGDCILFNRFNSLSLSESGKYVKIRPEGQWRVNGIDNQCEVLAISDSPLQTSQSECVIFLRGSKLNVFDGKLNVGDHLAISQKMLNGKFGVPATNIMNAFHGYPSIAYNGQLHQGEYNDFEGGREYEISSRQMAGMSQDGKTLYIVTTEMSATSAGVNCIDITNYMLAHGSWHVVNFDSGGSVAIVVDNQMLNYPARDAVRPVEDALLAVSLAPESTQITKFVFNRPAINPTIVSLVPVQLLAHNQYDEVLARDVKGFTFTCEPANLGRVDENYVFHAGSQAMTGKIIAEKYGMRTEMMVRIQSASDITLSPERILIDKKREHPISLTCKVGNASYPMDPAAFRWSVSDPSVCEVVNGVLHGLKDGDATLTARLDNIEKTMQVKVEIGKDKMLCEQFDNMNSFVSSSAGVSNMIFKTTDLPMNWTNGVNLNFNFIGNRSPFVELRKVMPFIGLPDSVTLDVNESTVTLIKEVQFYLTSNTNPAYKTVIVKPRVGLSPSVCVPFFNANIPWSTIDFPLQLSKMKIVFNATAALQSYNLCLRNLTAHYPEKTTNAVNDFLADKICFWVAINSATKAVKLHFQLLSQANVSVRLVGLDGKVNFIQESEYLPVGVYDRELALGGIPTGVYVVQLKINDRMLSKKFIIE